MIGAANFSARCALRAEATAEFGAAGNAGAMATEERSAKADSHASTRPSATDARQNDGKTRRGKEPFGGMPGVTQNPPAGLLKTKDLQAHKTHLSQYPPYPVCFGPENRSW